MIPVVELQGLALIAKLKRWQARTAEALPNLISHTNRLEIETRLFSLTFHFNHLLAPVILFGHVDPGSRQRYDVGGPFATGACITSHAS
jgi:hypothetical protein